MHIIHFLHFLKHSFNLFLLPTIFDKNKKNSRKIDYFLDLLQNYTDNDILYQKHKSVK